MKMTRAFAVLSAAALAVGAVPVLAEGAATPAVCGTTPPALAEGQQFVEHKLYLHGVSPVGNPDQAEAFANFAISDKKSMDDVAPTASQSKVDGLVAGTNANFNGNPAMSYFKHAFADEVRIVCAGATFSAASQGALTAKLFLDKAWADTAPDASKVTTATGSDTVKTHTVNFGGMDISAYDSAVLQITTGSAGAVHYDSTVHPSSFTYVTIEDVPTAEPTPTPTPAP